MFSGLAIEQGDIAILVKVDVDQNKETAQECGIESMPTFQFYKKGKKIDEIQGADIDAVRNKIMFLNESRKNRRSKNKGGEKYNITGVWMIKS